jgi:mono/diheme cytochrome c family protein
MVLAAAALLPLAGCSDNYAEDLRYPARTDLLVKEVPKNKDPDHFDSPGDLNEWMAGLKAKGAKVYDPANLDPGQRAELETALGKMFGTPAHPTVKADNLEEDAAATLKEAVASLQLDDKTLGEPNAGGSYLFRRHCLHCHGLTGNGRGPTGAWVNPHPRDYRRGIFKFTSSGQSFGTRKPRRADLVRTISQGIEGTSMPAFGAQSNSQFGVLAEEDIDKLVSYVIHLSLRGQVEYETMDAILSQQSKPREKVDLDGTVTEYARDRLTTLLGYWTEADNNVIKPEGGKELTGDELQASIKRGYELFVKPGEASCIGCHKDFGRQDNLKYDDWGTIVRPMDLTLGVYRGGRRPIDLYWRIHSGVNGANMPAFYESVKPTDQQLENLSNAKLAGLNKEDREKADLLQKYLDQLNLSPQERAAVKASFHTLPAPKQTEIEERVAALRLWDIVNFVKASPYPGMLPKDVRQTIYGSSASLVAER